MRNVATRGIALLAAFSILVGACDPGSTSPDTTDPTTSDPSESQVEATTSTRASTGPLTMRDGPLSIELPAGAGLDPEHLAIRWGTPPGEARVPPGSQPIGDAVSLELQEGRLSSNVTLRFALDAIEGTDEPLIPFIAFLDEQVGEWIPVTSQLESGSRSVSASVDHLSWWRLLGTPSAAVPSHEQLAAMAGESRTQANLGSTYLSATLIDHANSGDTIFLEIELGTLEPVLFLNQPESPNVLLVSVTNDDDVSVEPLYDRTSVAVWEPPTLFGPSHWEPLGDHFDQIYWYENLNWSLTILDAYHGNFVTALAGFVVEFLDDILTGLYGVEGGDRPIGPAFDYSNDDVEIHSLVFGTTSPPEARYRITMPLRVTGSGTASVHVHLTYQWTSAEKYIYHTTAAQLDEMVIDIQPRVSQGCGSLASPARSGTYNGIGPQNFHNLNAGDRVTVAADFPVTQWEGTPRFIRLNVYDSSNPARQPPTDGGFEDTASIRSSYFSEDASFPGSVSWTVPATGRYDLEWFTFGNAVWTVTCQPTS